MLAGVSKTAILTLRARADEHARPDRVFADPVAAAWCAQVAWPPELDAWYGPDAQQNIALRADDIDRVLARYCAGRAETTVVELGVGLGTRRMRLRALPGVAWGGVDLPEIVDLRRSLGAAEDEDLAASVLDPAWMDALGVPPEELVFVAEGLLYYLPRPEVDGLLDTLRARFPGAALIMDVVGANDYARLLANSEAVGAPVQWGYQGDFASVLADLGLDAVPGYEPARLLDDAIARYWHRYHAKLQAGIYWARSVPGFWAGRSGNVLGRLPSAGGSA